MALRRRRTSLAGTASQEAADRSLAGGLARRNTASQRSGSESPPTPSWLRTMRPGFAKTEVEELAPLSEPSTAGSARLKVTTVAEVGREVERGEERPRELRYLGTENNSGAVQDHLEEQLRGVAALPRCRRSCGRRSMTWML